MGVVDKLFEKYGRTVPAGTVLFRENEPGQEMFIIQRGSVKVTKRVGNIEKTLVVLHKGEFFGEMSILNNKPRSATIVTQEECDLLVIDSKTFEAMVKGNPEIALRIIKKLSARLQEADHQIENLLIKDNTAKVVNHIARLAVPGAKAGDGINTGAGAGDIGGMIGIPEDQVASILDKLTRAHMIALSSGKVIITDMGQLQRFIKYLDMKDNFGGLA